MAEKEKRILVLTTHNENGECECVMQDGCHANDSCAICNVGMTRQEAINRIAKAICKFEMMTARHICKDCSEECFDHLELEVVDKAEAALDALLED